MSEARVCAGCSAPIQLCNGFVKAGDILEGRKRPRELCWRCTETYRWTPEGTLERLPDLEKVG